MARKILALYHAEEGLEYLCLERGVASCRAKGKVQFANDPGLIRKVADWADEIYLAGEFPDAVYEWEAFPNVSTYNLKKLVGRTADRQVNSPAGARAAFQVCRQSMQGGVLHNNVAWVGVDQARVSVLEEDIAGKNRHKIQAVTTLPHSLAAAVVQTEKFEDNMDFILVWKGATNYILAICSPEGDVLVAVANPIDLPQNVAEISDEEMARFSRSVNRDLIGLATFYNQQFKGRGYSRCYFLGDNLLRRIFDRHPLTGLVYDFRFGLAKPLVQGLSEDEATGILHIVGNLFLKRGYNLIDPGIALNRRLDMGYRMVLSGLVLAILGALVYLGIDKMFNPLEQKAFATVQEKTTKLEKIYGQLRGQEEELHRLNQFHGWDEYYQKTYKNQPAWDKLVLAMAEAIPEEMVIEQLNLAPAQENNRFVYRVQVAGYMEVEEWQQGLEHLRRFGGTIHQSPYFRYESVVYSPEKEIGKGDGLSRFNYTFSLLLEPKGGGL